MNNTLDLEIGEVLTLITKQECYAYSYLQLERILDNFLISPWKIYMPDYTAIFIDVQNTKNNLQLFSSLKTYY